MSKKVTMIIGEPATGKSTLIRQLMASRPWVFQKLKWVPHHRNNESAILGDYSSSSEMFPGTDRLSMAVQPHARQWIRESGAQMFLFEGDRLGNLKFIEQLMADGHDLKVIRLMADKHTRQTRSIIQRRAQDSTFLRSRETKLRNMSTFLARASGVAYMEVPHLTGEDTRFIISNLTRSDSARRI